MRIGDNPEDDNEDYCNVCQDGGDGDLLCCDSCPKVYHLKCHMPAVDQVPEGDWQCLFCKPRDEIFSLIDSTDDSYPPQSLQHKSTREFMIACKFLSEIFSINESLVARHFFETVYKLKHQQVPASLSYIRNRLTFMDPDPYKCFNEMIEDLRLMFRQAYELYDPTMNERGHTIQFEAKFLAIYEEYSPLLENVVSDLQEVNVDKSATSV